MDEGDGIKGKEELLLTTASSISIDSLPSLVDGYGGVCFPAHIDRESYSVISSLGDFPEELEVKAFELTPEADSTVFYSSCKALAGKKLIRSSDAHYLENMLEATVEIDLPECTPQAVVNYILNK
jgi:hypothetical protein